MARTIRGRIHVAFLVMSVITGALGLTSTLQIREAGLLAEKTFDQSLMSINYARAAAADFEAMQGAFIRRSLVTDEAEREVLDRRMEDLRKSLSEDLTIAGERSQSTRAAKSAAEAKRAVALWSSAQDALGKPERALADWNSLATLAAPVDQQIDLLVNYTAGDGFIHRQSAKAIVAADIRTNLVFTALALVMAAVVARLLTRRIIRPVAAASAVAEQIAQGKLDCIVPTGNGDELGNLLSAMSTMRDNLRQIMDREVAQRRSAQTRLADALESSREGIVVVDAGGSIALANSQLAEFLAISPELLQPGMPVSALANAIDAPSLASGELLNDASGRPITEDARLADGRWLRVSRSATQEGGFVAVLSDLTVLKDQEEKLRATNLSLDAALENMSQGLCLYDARSRLVVVNRRFMEIFHLNPADVRPGLTLLEVLSLKVSTGIYGRTRAADLLAARFKRDGTPVGGTMFDELSNGRIVALAHQPTADGGWIDTYEDVTERRTAEAQISFMARHDALTRIPNRTLFGERLDIALAQLGRGSGFAVLCLDLDRFKQVNDTFGHPGGDELLRQVADRLQACVREVDTVSRLGGDEFAIVQCDVQRPEDTAILARRILEVMDDPFVIAQRSTSVSVSIGIAIAPADGTSSITLLKNADAALYRAKAEGRGAWRFFEPEMEARLQIRRALEIDLRQGVEDKQFELYFQPLYDLSQDRIGGFEALLRWQHPTRGLVLPSDFIPLAEESGLIVPLGEWVLQQSCLEARNWPSHVKIAVNVSPAQFKGGERLVNAIKEALAISGLPPYRLELEITETVLLTNSAGTLDILHTLRGMGIRFAMDDFGTGYSSLNYLRSFPFDKIKIDQSFIRDLTSMNESAVIVRAITGLGSSLGMRTTAEGVETAEQLARLRAEGCDEAQGYYFSRPVPARSVGALLEQWNGVATVAA